MCSHIPSPLELDVGTSRVVRRHHSMSSEPTRESAIDLGLDITGVLDEVTDATQ